MTPTSGNRSPLTDPPIHRIEEIAVLVADRSRARLFHIIEDSNELQEIRDLINSDARMAENQLVSDRQGRAAYGGLYGRRGRRTTFGKSGTKRYLTTEHFASAICDSISEYLSTGKISIRQFYVIASPELMGALRPYLQKLAGNATLVEIPKNITRQDTSTIRSYLPERLWPRRVAGITLE